MVIDVSVVRLCMRQLNSDQSWIKELERSVASVVVGSGLWSQVHRKKSRQRNIICCRLTGDDEDFCHYLDAANTKSFR